MAGAHWNRSGRRSGGYRPRHPTMGPAPDGTPVQSIQCFEGRHADCRGDCKPFAPMICECPCHRHADSDLPAAG